MPRKQSFFSGRALSERQTTKEIIPTEENKLDEALGLINFEREKNGVEPLIIDQKLSDLAQKKADDMLQNNYFDHDSPSLGSPFDMMKENNINFQTAGENIAKGQMSAEEVVKSWLESPSHKENILRKEFTNTGMGVAEDGDEIYWVQWFTG